MRTILRKFFEALMVIFLKTSFRWRLNESNLLRFLGILNDYSILLHLRILKILKSYPIWLYLSKENSNAYGYPPPNNYNYTGRRLLTALING